MKQLLLVRHAESSWQADVNADIDRKLTKKGNNDADEMSILIKSNISKLDKIISSPAVRTISTSQYFANVFNINFSDIQLDIGLYEKGVKYFRKLISEQNNSLENIMFVAHNPTLTNIVSNLTGDETSILEPCSVVCIDYNISKWAEIENTNGKLIFIKSPSSFQ